FGVAACVGLMLIGLPYGALWGSGGGALRFIPSVGVWVGASLPIALSLAVFPGWGQPALVAAVFVVLEVAANVGVEPWLYGHSAGLSPVALLVAVIFWTWLWGPIGFLLATPLTVCVMVVGRHLPAAGFLLVLMGNQPCLHARAPYVQRLLARGQGTAAARAGSGRGGRGGRALRGIERSRHGLRRDPRGRPGLCETGSRARPHHRCGCRVRPPGDTEDRRGPRGGTGAGRGRRQGRRR